MCSAPAVLAPVAAGALAPRERKVKDFDEDLQNEFCFNPEYPVNPVKKVSLKGLNCYVIINLKSR